MEARAGNGAQALDLEAGPAPSAWPARVKRARAFASGLGSGIRKDLQARVACYDSDWSDAGKEGMRTIARVLAASVYIFFASALPAIAFGQQLSYYTDGKLDVTQTLLSTGITGVIQAFIGGQPLLIVGVAEPIVILYHLMYDYCQGRGTDFLAWSAWACVWAALFLVVLSVLNACAAINKFTRFCGETFGMLIAILFLQQSITGLVGEFSAPFGAAEPYLQTLNGLFGLLLAFVYIWTSHLMSGARSWKVGTTFLRAVLADYGFAFMVVAASGLSFALRGYQGVPQRLDVLPLAQSSWLQERGPETAKGMSARVSGPEIAAAIVPGFVISVLFFFDHSVSSQLAQQSQFQVKKRSAYHWDLLLLAAMTVFCGLLGLPPVNGVLPQAPLHTRALCSKAAPPKESPPAPSLGRTQAKGDLPKIQVCENRVSNLVQATLCVVLFAFADRVLTFVPSSVIWAFFAFMSLESLPGNQLWERIQVCLSDRKRRALFLTGAHAVYLETVPFRTIVAFTAIQVVCLLVIWTITVWTGLFGISFPLWIMALVPLRLFLLPRFITAQHLRDLDGAEGEVGIEELPPGGHVAGDGTDWTPEDAQEIVDRHTYGRFFGLRFRKRLSGSQAEERRSARTLERRHSIDVASAVWSERSYTDLALLNASSASVPKPGGEAEGTSAEARK